MIVVALSCIAFLLIVTPIGVTWSERRRRARETYLAARLDRKRVEADARVNHHYDTLPDFVNGDPK